ncbi:MAG: TIGR04283 family arsenosugar biosynthesis glycosyltransferase [Pseudomonadota bacterium]
MTDDIAVIVPAWNEADNLDQLLPLLIADAFAEIIVVDCGSDDGTDKTVSRYAPHVRLIRSNKGRGQQLAAGVTASTAPILLFLHADTRLPPAADTVIRQTLDTPGTAAGCFRLSFDEPGKLLSVFAWLTRFESPFTTFGDQAFFMRRQTLNNAGGVPEIALFEDVELRRRLRRQGRFRKVQPGVTTSARRFREVGVMRTQVQNAWFLTQYLCGREPSKLATRYRTRPRSRFHT